MHSVVIFSVDRVDRTAAENAAARQRAERYMHSRGVTFKRANGSYRGTREQSYIVADDEPVLATVRTIAAWNAQESLLRVNARGQAWLETPGGDCLASLGYLVNVAPNVAQESEAFTETDGAYYIAAGG